MICPKCGKELENGKQIFCPNCGTRIENAVSQEKSPYQPPSAYQQSNGYQQPSGYQQSNGYQQPSGYQQSNGYQQPSGYQQSNGYQQPSGYQQSNGYQQPSGYQQSNGYQQSSGYQQSNGYQQPSGYQQSNGYQQPSGYQQSNGYQQPSGYQQSNGYQQPGGYQQSNGYQQPNGYQYPNTYQQSGMYQPELPMNWYKFVIYVMLFLSALGNVIGAVQYFTGSSVTSMIGEQVNIEMVYAIFPSLRFLLYFCGIACIGLGVLAIITRQWLAHFDKKGITGLLLLYAGNAVVSLIYIIGFFAIFSPALNTLGSDEFAAVVVVLAVSSIGTILGAVIMMVLNHVYFKKRAHLFH